MVSTGTRAHMVAQARVEGATAQVHFSSQSSALHSSQVRLNKVCICSAVPEASADAQTMLKPVDVTCWWIISVHALA